MGKIPCLERDFGYLKDENELKWQPGWRMKLRKVENLLIAAALGLVLILVGLAIFSLTKTWGADPEPSQYSGESVSGAALGSED